MNANEVGPMAEGPRVGTDRLTADLRMLAADMEQLLKATGSQAGEHVAQVRSKAEESLRTAMAHVADLQDAAVAKTRAAGRATDDYVRANPWQVMAIGAVAGFAFGLLLPRRGSSDR